MWLEPPPKPSSNTEQALRDLANYYRQLVVYHQQSAALAASQLAQIETLLSSGLQASSMETSPFTSSLTGYKPAEWTAELEPTSKAAVSEIELPTPEELIESLQKILAVNRGKILRLDYLVLETAETRSIHSQHYPELKRQLQKLLEQGEKQGFWASIPDSPNCWTLDLNDFPDLVSQLKVRKSQKKPKKTSRAAYNRSRLPNTGRMKQYETLTAAIAQCLREHSPQSMDAHQVMQWIYPDGLSEKLRSKAYQAVSDGLNKGCSRKRWQREEIGWYFWE